jgi:hypothetical protein
MKTSFEVRPLHHPDIVGPVYAMAAVVRREGTGHPLFAFTVLDGTVLRTCYVDLESTGSSATVAIVNAAYVAKRPVEIGLSTGSLPGEVAWVQVSKPPA